MSGNLIIKKSFILFLFIEFLVFADLKWPTMMDQIWKSNITVMHKSWNKQNLIPIGKNTLTEKDNKNKLKIKS